MQGSSMLYANMHTYSAVRTGTIYDINILRLIHINALSAPADQRERDTAATAFVFPLHAGTTEERSPAAAIPT